MERSSGIFLGSHFTNNLKVGGELAWYAQPSNSSTGYSWKFTPDNSGVYEEIEEITLHASTTAVGVPGMILWKFKAVKKGEGSLLFELFPPGGEEPVETVTVRVKVEK